MPVRKTESRIPNGFTADDLGLKAVAATNANVILISFLSSPTAARRIQNYAVFVTDAALAGTVNSYEWSFTNGAGTTLTTTNGMAEFTPQNVGTLTVTVNLKNASNTTLHTVTLTQQVISLNESLELLIEQTENNFPGAAHPETSREMLNDIRPYVNVILPIATDDLYNKALCSLAYARILQLDHLHRNLLLEDLANILHTQPANFYSQSKDGFGICKTRPQLLAMFLDNPATPGTAYLNAGTLELVAGATSKQRTDNATAIQAAFTALSTDIQTDLFNLLRFPKSHVAMAKKIIDGIHTRYYNTPPPTAPAQPVAIGATLADTNSAKRIITEYEKGLIAYATGSNPLTASPFSASVFRLFNNSVWAIAVSPLSGTAGGGASPSTTVPATVGIPEKLPTLTFIAHHDTEAGFGAGSVGFLRKAFLYHDSYALNPGVMRSFEDLIDTLNLSPDPIGRLRLVTHFGGPRGSTSLANVGAMFLPFFTGQTQNDGSATPHNQTFAEHFKFAISDDEGIKGQFEKIYFPSFQPDFLSKMTMNTHTDPTQRPYYQAIFRFLQANNHASLAPFGLQNSGPPSASVLTIMKWAANLFVINNFPIQVRASNPNVVAAATVPTLVKDAFTSFVNVKLASLATATGPTTSANITALANAFSSQTTASLNANSFSIPGAFILSSVYLDNHNTFRTKLAAVKNRLNNSFVDIRGCRVGQDRNFMQAVRSFFGNPGSEPVVSGPEWFQQMGNIGFQANNSESGLDVFFNSGISGTHVTATDVQRDYSAWAGRIGINSQISFWTNLFNGNAYEVISLAWKTLLPPIGMRSDRLTAMSTQNYPDTIATLKSLFGLAANSAPLPADCTTFNTNSFPSVATLTGIQNAVLPLNDTQTTELQNQLTALTTLATTVGATLPAAPSPVTKAHLNTCIDTIKQRLVTLSGIAPLIASIKSKLANSRAGYRYMLSTGLPLLVQSASTEDETFLIYNLDLQTNALKSFKTFQFEAPLPAATLTAIDSINPTGSAAVNTQGTADPNDDTLTDLGNGLAFSRLTIDHQNSQTAVNPSEEFHEHIKTVP